MTSDRNDERVGDGDLRHGRDPLKTRRGQMCPAHAPTSFMLTFGAVEPGSTRHPDTDLF